MNQTNSKHLLCETEDCQSFFVQSLPEYLKHIRDFHIKQNNILCMYKSCSLSVFKTYNSYYQHCKRKHFVDLKPQHGDLSATAPTVQPESDMSEVLLDGGPEFLLDINRAELHVNEPSDALPEILLSNNQSDASDRSLRQTDFTIDQQHYLPFMALKITEEYGLTQVKAS